MKKKSGLLARESTKMNAPKVYRHKWKIMKIRNEGDAFTYFSLYRRKFGFWSFVTAHTSKEKCLEHVRDFEKNGSINEEVWRSK